MSTIYTSILGCLDIYDRDFIQYTKCLCRGVEILISNKPEEKVRQALLYFLINKSSLFPDLIDIKVEYNHLDLAIYKKINNDDFNPIQYPSVIIEVKREEENLLNHQNQLHGYLREQRSSVGILFNGHNVIVIDKLNESDFKKSHLDSMEDIPSIIVRGLHQERQNLSEFESARNGSLDSFISLAKKYGKYGTHKFVFALKNETVPISGCFFRCNQDKIHYDIYGKYSRKSNFSFNHSEFSKLISISYGEVMEV